MCSKFKLQYGLTLIELSIVLMILASLAVVSTRFMYDDFNRDIADKTVAEMWAVGEYAVAYYAMHSGWPDMSSNCANATQEMENKNLLQGLKIKTIGGGRNILSPWYGVSEYEPYITSCTTRSKGFEIKIVMPLETDSEWSNYMHHKLPLAKLTSATATVGPIVTVTVPPPAGVVALNSYLMRKDDPNRISGQISLNDMETYINMNGNKIVDFDVATGTFNYSNSQFYIDMQQRSVLSNLMIIPQTVSSFSPYTVPASYGNKNCSLGSHGKFSLDICEKDKTQTINANGGTVTAPSNQYAKTPQGSIKANDIYLKSINKWVSQLNNILPKRIQVEHYSNVVNGMTLTTTVNCVAEFGAAYNTLEYEVWPQKIYPNSRSTEHEFSVSANGVVSIKHLIGGTSTIDLFSSAYADAYCVKP